MKSTNFVLLDGLRGLGALFVLYGHTAHFWSSYMPVSGAVMVDMFFLISGFVIAYSYESRIKAGMRLGEFMTHRIVRLFPLYLMGTVIGFAVLWATMLGDHDFGAKSIALTEQLIPQLFMLPSPEFLGAEFQANEYAYPYSMNPPAWTLFFELAVNIVYVLAFRWLTTKRLIAVVVVSALALVATVMFFGRIDAGSEWGSFWGGFARASFGFFAGVMVYRLVGSPSDATRPVRKNSLLIALLIALLIPIVCFLPATDELRPYLDLFLALGCAVPLLWVCQSIEPPQSLKALFLLGGRISYAIYILHWPFRAIGDRLGWRSNFIYDIAPIGGIVMLVTAVALAYFAEKYYDRPLRRWLVRRLKARAMRRALARSPATGFAE